MGLGMPNLFTTMHIRKMAHLLDFGGLDHLSGKTIQVSYQYTLLELGLYSDLCDWDYDDWGHLTTKMWITHLWRFCSSHQIRICSNGPLIKANRVNDRSLMFLFCFHGLRKDQLATLRRCSYYLQVNNLSDITNMQGTQI